MLDNLDSSVPEKANDILEWSLWSWPDRLEENSYEQF